MVINGPIAAGKSTVAQALGQQLRQHGHPTAVVDLDEFYSMMSASRWAVPRSGIGRGWPQRH